MTNSAFAEILVCSLASTNSLLVSRKQCTAIRR